MNLIYQFLKQKNIKVIGLIIDELGGKSMTKFVGLKAKSYLCYRRKHKELVKNKKKYNKDLKVKGIMSLLTKLIKLLSVQMMIKNAIS